MSESKQTEKVDMEALRAFTIDNGRGFRLMFPSGWAISVQWGPSHYCDRYSAICRLEPEPRDRLYWTSDTVEIAVLDPKGNMIPVSVDGEAVAGWQDVTQVVKVITFLSTSRHLSVKSASAFCQRATALKKCKTRKTKLESAK